MNKNKYCNICFAMDRELKSLKIKSFQQLGIQNSKLLLCAWCKAAMIKVDIFIKMVKESQNMLNDKILLKKIDINKYNGALSTVKLDSINIIPCSELVQDSVYDADSNVGSNQKELLEEKFSNQVIDNKSNTNLFEVQLLSIEEQKRGIYDKMSSEKFRNCKYKCVLCGSSFVTPEAFDDHKWRHTEEAGPHRCPICSLRFKSNLVLAQHKLSHKRRFRCTECGHTATRWAHALTHAAKCVDTPQVCVCQVCKKIFNDTLSLERHRRVHTRVKKYICNDCSKRFTTKQHLIVHIRTHSGAKPFGCSKCDKSFSTNSNLTSHASVHSEHRRHYCVECNTSYKTEKSLIKHYKMSVAHTQLGEKLSCESCPKQFTSETSFMNHVKHGHSTHRCHLCDKMFSNKSNLKKHIRCVHDVIGNK